LNNFYQIQTKCYRNSDTVFFFLILPSKRGLGYPGLMSMSTNLIGQNEASARLQHVGPPLVAIEVGRHDTASIGRRAAHPYYEMKEKLHDHKSATRLDMHRQLKSLTSRPAPTGRLWPFDVVRLVRATSTNTTSPGSQSSQSTTTAAGVVVNPCRQAADAARSSCRSDEARGARTGPRRRTWRAA
jgi:hypothetical protein